MGRKGICLVFGFKLIRYVFECNGELKVEDMLMTLLPLKAAEKGHWKIGQYITTWDLILAHSTWRSEQQLKVPVKTHYVYIWDFPQTLFASHQGKGLYDNDGTLTLTNIKFKG